MGFNSGFKGLNSGQWIQVVPCGQTDGRPDMSKIIVVFHNFGKAPKNYKPVCERVVKVIREGFPESKHVVKQHVRNKTPVSFHMLLDL